MEGLIGQIIMFAGTYAPRNWAFCDGQLLPISENSSLFSIIGTQFGGNGQTTFALPNLCSRRAVGVGQGANLSNVVQGMTYGQETVSLVEQQMPSHSHTVACSSGNGDQASPVSGIPAAESYPPADLWYFGDPDSSMNEEMLSETGAGSPFPVITPGLGMYYIICIDGYYPPRPD